MSTIKLFFRPSQQTSAPGTLYFQLISQRKVKRIATSHHIYPHEWDAAHATLLIPKEESPRRRELLLLQSVLRYELAQRTRLLHTLECTQPHVPLETLETAFQQLPACKTVFTFLDEQVERALRIQHHGTARTYSSTTRSFREFRSQTDLLFSDLTPEVILSYEAWLYHRGLMPNTVRFYLRTLRTLLNKAAASKERLLAPPVNLFSQIHLSYVTTTKRALTLSEVYSIEHASLNERSTTSLARDLFMFSFFMRGISFVDMAHLRKSDLSNGFFTYSRRKTHQTITIQNEQVIQRIINSYASQTEGTPYLLPLLTQILPEESEHHACQRLQARINRALKRLGRKLNLPIPLTTYVARHSWASIAQSMDVPLAIISKGMGHHSYQTTQIYLNSIDTSRVNEANHRIIAAVTQKKRSH